MDLLFNGGGLGPLLWNKYFSSASHILVISTQTKAMVRSKSTFCVFLDIFSAPSLFWKMYFCTFELRLCVHSIICAVVWSIPGIKCRSVAGLPSVQSAYYCSSPHFFGIFILETSWNFNTMTLKAWLTSSTVLHRNVHKENASHKNKYFSWTFSGTITTHRFSRAHIQTLVSRWT